VHKKQSLTLSIPMRMEGFSGVALAISVIVFLGLSLHTLDQFPIMDGLRWYGDETWMLLAWKHLLTHGTTIVPIALGSQLLSSPGLLLGSPWIAAIFYGFPQLLAPVGTDIVGVGRAVSFVLGIGVLGVLAGAAYRLRINMQCAALAIALLATTRNFSFATHGARYDILTGLALLAFVTVVATLLHDSTNKRGGVKGMGSATYLLIGAAGMFIPFTISPHLEVLLPPIVLFSAWRIGAIRSVKGTAAFVSGGMIGSVVIILLYAVGNHTFSLASGISSDNQFGSVLNNLPIRHLFSWSAQSHQLWAKGYYLWHEATLFAFVLPLILVSESYLLITKRTHHTTAFVTGCLLLALLVALFVQSTLPYYLIHILPLAALTFALHLKEWSKLSWSAPSIAFASLALTVVICFQSIPELIHAGRIGNRMSEANTAAIQAAVEQASRGWEPGGKKPLVLAQGPAIHELLRDTSLRVMNESFLFFPLKQTNGYPPDTVMTREGVDYILDYHKPMTAEYAAAVQRGKPIFSRIGPFLDRKVDYFKDTTSEMDTLTMYQFDPSK